ncbi:BRO family protein [uncultured Parasutterella sp.]|uniref:BRO family protein n=1 Tax=uncultured Parasutterella sp. TaxID=1263098 RepID=UPI0025B43608|nr:BRO family protein [uncultured Parasutterella sp.]
MSNSLALANFKFEDCSIRVYGDFIKPLFVAVDVCNALKLTNPSESLKALAPFERAKLNLGAGKPNVNAVTESGLYTLILRCRDAIKEGTFAYRFRLWVTNEVLPAIRKQGYYQVTSNTLTPAQQHQIQIAVAARAQKTAHNYQTIYRALKNRFQVARYDQIPQSQFKEALRFIQSVDLSVPETSESTGEIFYYNARTLSEHELRALANLIYLRELGKPTFAQVYKGLRSLNSELAPRFYSLIAEGDFPVAALKDVLSRNQMDFTRPIR